MPFDDSGKRFIAKSFVKPNRLLVDLSIARNKKDFTGALEWKQWNEEGSKG